VEGKMPFQALRTYSEQKKVNDLKKSAQPPPVFFRRGGAQYSQYKDIW
jgi:hypothetical protein